jgi:adenylate cyclase
MAEDEQTQAQDEQPQPKSAGEEPDQDDVDAARAPAAAISAWRKTDQSPRALRAAKALRKLLPGDSQLGDPLSTAGDEPSLVIARRVAETGASRPSAARELGLGALQVWQAMSEAQGRGRGERELAILFTDLVDFSEWALEAGDEAVLELLRRVGSVEEGVIAGHGGRVVKRLGDGVMAVFDEPGEAVRAACEACHEVAELSVDGYSPRLRAGLHSGKPRRIGGDYVGVDVNVAARVAAGAGGGQVLVSGPTREHLDGDAFECKRVRRFKAKGAPKDLEVYSVEPI